MYTLGGTDVCWASNLQKIGAHCTIEAKYVAVTEAGKNMVWLQGFLDALGKKCEKNILCNDSQCHYFY